MKKTNRKPDFSKMTEYRQNIRYSCGHVVPVYTLGYKPKVDNKCECPHCRNLRLSRFMGLDKRINEFGIECFTIPPKEGHTIIISETNPCFYSYKKREKEAAGVQ